MVQDQVSMEAVAERWPVVCQLLLDKHRVMCCHVTTASSSSARAQDAYGKLNCIDSEVFRCSGVHLQSLLMGRTLPEQFQMSWETVESLPCLLTCPVMVSSSWWWWRFPGGWLSLQLGIDSSRVMIWFRYVPSLKSIGSSQVPIQSSSWSCIGMRGALCRVTRDVFSSSDGIIWQVPLLIPGAATSSIILLACTKVATSCS